MRYIIETYRHIGFVLAEIALTKPDESISVARRKCADAKKLERMAVRAASNNDKNPRYGKDIVRARDQQKKYCPKASGKMTHEKDPNINTG